MCEFEELVKLEPQQILFNFSHVLVLIKHALPFEFLIYWTYLLIAELFHQSVPRTAQSSAGTAN